MEEGLGETVYSIDVDYSWGQSHQDLVENTVVPKFDGEYVGNTFVELGAGDYSQALTEAMNSGADIIYSATTGTDQVQLSTQANEFGIYDEDIQLTFPFSSLTEGEQISQSILNNGNWSAALQWYWQSGSDAGNTFTEEYRDEYGEVPTSQGMMYSAVRTYLKAVGEADSTDPEAVSQALNGRDIEPSIWGVGEHYRECNHGPVYPNLFVRGRPESEVEESNYFEVVNKDSDPESNLMRSCEETGCSL
jgi:ABC-type branched-subunit amino acid transport system substrate-binding protein